jgi:hypothetical protein
MNSTLTRIAASPSRAVASASLPNVSGPTLGQWV